MLEEGARGSKASLQRLREQVLSTVSLSTRSQRDGVVKISPVLILTCKSCQCDTSDLKARQEQPFRSLQYGECSS